MTITRKQSGVTLLEVLISLFLINVVLCGLITIESFIIQMSSTNYLKSIAAIQATNLFELLKLQKNTHANVSALYLKWQEETQYLLPSAKFEHHCYTHQCSIFIQWYFNKPQYLRFTRRL
jgi:Tfp pilus assembly protein PilV